MEIKQLEPGFSICHAIYPADMAEVKANGFLSIICNRQPGEAEDHSDDAALRKAAEEAGLEWCEIPVTPGEYTPDAIEAFGHAIETLPTPILAFCRTGRRAISLWAHTQAQKADCDIGPLLQAAHAAGHDLSDQHDALIKR
ncbi:TIGR01244 family sulfur transferase [Neptunomonas antarctica]|uniref:TIGR01244 family protein n=1 Tax=Neptunomonas antarctica TaxID=619304 RepID=A0A1N7J4N5_9GAMM|nr:TIGR01244 family sulfur transferase [Neptunomonas antarctica]SIS44181.1 TIGR01244 family protein [Neptunomonas antarctica]